MPMDVSLKSYGSYFFGHFGPWLIQVLCDHPCPLAHLSLRGPSLNISETVH